MLESAKQRRGITPYEWLKMVALLSDVGYKMGDNVEYLSKYRVLPYDEKRAEFYTKTFQWFTCVVQRAPRRPRACGQHAAHGVSLCHVGTRSTSSLAQLSS